MGHATSTGYGQNGLEEVGGVRTPWCERVCAKGRNRLGLTRFDSTHLNRRFIPIRRHIKAGHVTGDYVGTHTPRHMAANLAVMAANLTHPAAVHADLEALFGALGADWRQLE